MVTDWVKPTRKYTATTLCGCLQHEFCYITVQGRLPLPLLPMCKILIIKLFCYNTDSTMDPKISVITRFQCTCNPFNTWSNKHEKATRNKYSSRPNQQDIGPSHPTSCRYTTRWMFNWASSEPGQLDNYRWWLAREWEKTELTSHKISLLYLISRVRFPTPGSVLRWI